MEELKNGIFYKLKKINIDHYCRPTHLKSQLLQTRKNVPQNSVGGRIPLTGKRNIYPTCVHN